MSSQPPVYDRLLRALTAVYQGNLNPGITEFQLPTKSYTDRSLFEEEQKLLRRLPIVVAHVSQLASPGACLVHDALGAPLIIVRNRDGALKAMFNVCRHRGTRLLEHEGFCKVRKGFHCRYHGWAYDIDGRLVNVPKEELFPSLDKAAHNLVSVPVHERFGFVWVVATPGDEYDFASFLDPLEDDLTPLQLENHVVFRRGTATRRTNWKIVMEAFLDGYHVRHLHKSTVGPYFQDHQSFTEAAGPHVRSIVGRSGFAEAIENDAIENVREIATPTYVFFPNTIFVVQPDFVSRATVYPSSIDQIYWEHDLIVPEPPKTEKALAHWELNYELIQNGVFDKEDLWVCEQIQKGIASGANDFVTCGTEEAPIYWWHQELKKRLRST